MEIPFLEPVAPRYIYVNPETNQVHLMVPIASGDSIGNDNTCKTVLALKEFFGEAGDAGALFELQNYKGALETDISQIPGESEIKQQKQDRLDQIAQYINILMVVQYTPEIERLHTTFPEYPQAVKTLFKERSNLYSMVLRPTSADPYLRTPDPVFSVQRDGCTLRIMTPEEAEKPRRDNCYIWDGKHLVYNSFDGIREDIPLTNEAYFLQLLDEQLQFNSTDTLILTSYGMNELITNNCVPHTRNDGGQFLYSALHELYNHIKMPEQGPKAMLTQAVLESQAGKEVNFADIQDALITKSRELFGLEVNFREAQIRASRNQPFTIIEASQNYIDQQMGFDSDTTPEEYVSALLNYCTTEDFETIAISTLTTSPFNTVENNAKAAEKNSILTQFFLGEVNIHCVSHGMTDANFGMVLDGSNVLSRGIAMTVITALKKGTSIEESLCAYVNKNATLFHLNRQLTPNDILEIKQKFTEQYTAIRNSDHFDEFILLDTTIKQGKFVNHQGAICTDFSEMIGAGYPALDNEFFQHKRDDFKAINGVVNPRNDWVQAEGINMEEAQFISYVGGLVKQNPSGIVVDLMINVLNNIPMEERTALIIKLGKNLHSIYMREALIKTLPTEGQIEFLLIALGDNILKTFMLTNLLQNLLPAVQIGVIRRLDPRLLVIKYDDQLKQVFKVLSGEAKTAFITVLGKNLISIIKNGVQLAEVLQTLSADGQTALMTRLGMNLTSIIKNGDQLTGVLQTLSADGQTALMTRLGMNIISIIENGKELAHVLRTLQQEDQITLLNTCGSVNPSLNIKYPWDLVEVLQALLPDVTKVFISTITEPASNIASIIETANDLRRILEALTSDTQIVLITALGSNITSIIKREYELENILKALSSDAQIALIKTLGPESIDQYDLDLILPRLLPDAQTVFITTLGMNITSKITNGSYLAKVLETLRGSPDAQSTLMTSLGTNITSLFPDRFGAITSLFTDTHVPRFSAVLEELSARTNSSSSILSAAINLADENPVLGFAAVMAELTRRVKSVRTPELLSKPAAPLSAVLQQLSPDAQTTLIKTLGSKSS